MMLLAWVGLSAAGSGGRAQRVGGRITEIPRGCSGGVQVLNDEYFVFYSKKANCMIAYEPISMLECGQKLVDRRILTASLYSPVCLLEKSVSTS